MSAEARRGSGYCGVALIRDYEQVIVRGIDDVEVTNRPNTAQGPLCLFVHVNGTHQHLRNGAVQAPGLVIYRLWGWLTSTHLTISTLNPQSTLSKHTYLQTTRWVGLRHTLPHDYTLTDATASYDAHVHLPEIRCCSAILAHVDR